MAAGLGRVSLLPRKGGRTRLARKRLTLFLFAVPYPVRLERGGSYRRGLSPSSSTRENSNGQCKGTGAARVPFARVQGKASSRAPLAFL